MISLGLIYLTPSAEIAIFAAGKLVDKVLSYKPKPKTKAAKRRKRWAKANRG